MERSFEDRYTTVLPPLENEEFLLGYLWKGTLMSGRVNARGSVAALVGRTAVQPPWLVPGNLKHVSQELGHIAPTVDFLVEKHTVLPALLPFVRLSAVEPLLKHVHDGLVVAGVTNYVGVTGRGIETRPAMGVCQSCVEEDLAQIGAPFWRRAHMLPGLGVCPVHRESLYAGCGACAFSQPNCRHPRLPSEKCWCGREHRLAYPELPPEDTEVLGEMSEIAQQLLEGKLKAFINEDLGAWYHLRAQQMGYADSTRLHTAELAKDLAAKYPLGIQRRLNSTITGKSPTANWVATTLGAVEAPLPIGRNLMLLHHFGGLPTADELEHARAHRTMIEEHRVVQRTMRKKTATYTVKGVVNLIQACLKESPQASRTDILDAVGRAAAWLREVAPVTYEAVMPAPHRGESAAKIELARNLLNLDGRGAEHVRKRRQEMLASTARPMPISQRQLLTGLPNGNTIVSNKLTRMPLTRAALDECVESRADYQERLASWHLKNPEGDDSDVEYTRVARRTGLNLSKLDRINAILTARRNGTGSSEQDEPGTAEPWNGE